MSSGMFASFLANNANSIFSAGQMLTNTYLEVERRKREHRLMEQQIKINSDLTAEMLTIEHEKTLGKSAEVSDQVAKAQLQILKQERVAEGSAKVQAAVTGASGRRVELAQAQSIDGAAGDALTELSDVSEKQQEALIDQSRYITRKAIMDMTASAVGIRKPPGVAELMLPNIADAVDARLSDRKFVKDRDAATAAAASGSNVSGTTQTASAENFTIL